MLPTQVAVNRLLDDGGVDRLFGQRLIGRLRTHGLNSVGAEAHSFMWQCGSPGATLARATYELLQRDLIDGRYLTAQQSKQDLESLEHPSFVTPSAMLWSAWGGRT